MQKAWKFHILLTAKVHFFWDFFLLDVGSYVFLQFEFGAAGELTRARGGGRRKSKQNGRKSTRSANFELH